MPMLYQSNQLKNLSSSRDKKNEIFKKKPPIKNHVGLLLMSNLFVSSKLCKKTAFNNDNEDAALTKPNQKNL
jgi:hypothetical protein